MLKQRYRNVILIFSLLYGVMLFAESPLSIIRNNNFSSDEGSKKLTELARTPGICKTLHQYLFSDKETLFKQLGDESYEKRHIATRALIMAGKKIKDDVQKLLKTTDDPEIKFRCHKILKEINKTSGHTDFIMKSALFVILSSDENPPENTDFLHYYFSNYNKLDKKLQSMLEEALKRSEGREKLSSSIEKIMKQEHNPAKYKTLNSALKKIAPDRYALISKKLKAWNEIEKLDINRLADEYSNATSHSTLEIDNVANKLRAVPGFELVKDEYVRKILFKRRSFYPTLAIILVSDNIAPYVEDIIKMLKQAEGDPTIYNHVKFINFELKTAKNSKQILAPYTDFFLNFQDDYFYPLGVFLINNPAKYKKCMINNMVSNSSRKATDFLIRHFPEDKEKFQQLIVEKIKKNSRNSPYGIINKSYLLSKLGYKGHDLDKWALSYLKTNPNNFFRISPSALVSMNIDPDIIAEKIIPLWLNGSNENNSLRSLESNSAHYMLKCSPRYKKQVDNYIYHSFLDCSFNGLALELTDIIAKNTPERINDIYTATIEKIRKEHENNSYINKYLFYPFCDKFAAIFQRYPKKKDIVRSYLKDKNSYIRYFAALTLLQADSSDEDAFLAIQDLLKHREKLLSDYENKLITIFLKRKPIPETLVNKELELFHNKILKKAEGNKSIWNYTTFVSSLTPEHRICMETLKNFLKQHPDMPLNLAKTVIDGILNIDDQDSFARDLLMEKFMKADYTEEIALIEVMTKHKIEVAVPADKVKNVDITPELVDFACKALQNSEKNLAVMLPVFTKAIDQNKLPSWPIWKIMLDFDKIRDALFPLVLNSFLKSHTDSYEYVKILKWFPELLKPHIPEMLAHYRKLESPKAVDAMTYLIAYLKLDAANFAEVVEKHYKGVKGERRTLFHDFAMAMINPDKNVREECTTRFVNYVERNPIPATAVDHPIVDAGNIFEFPDITDPMLVRLFNSKNYEIYQRVIWAFSAKHPLSDSARKTYTDILEKYAAGDNNNRVDLIVQSLSETLDEAEYFLPLLQKIPQPKLDDNRQLKKLIETLKSQKKENPGTIDKP